MKVLRNGQQVEFSLIEGSLVQETVFRSQASMEMPVKDFLLPLGENDKITVVASNLGLARQMVRMHQAEMEQAEREERDVAAQDSTELFKVFTDLMLEALLGAAHAERRVLVNQYVGVLRREKVANLDKAIGLIEEEQAKRAGLASSADILTTLSGSENLTLSVEEAKALPQPEPSSYKVGQRIIMIHLPHTGATVRSLDESGVGIDYDTDGAEERGTYEALYSHIRPMPRY